MGLAKQSESGFGGGGGKDRGQMQLQDRTESRDRYCSANIAFEYWIISSIWLEPRFDMTVSLNVLHRVSRCFRHLILIKSEYS